MALQGPFPDLSEPARQAFLGASIKLSRSDGHVIYFQEDTATALYFVSKGFIRLSHLMEDGSAVLFAILPKGEIFGELGVFEKGLYCDTATAIGDTVIHALPTQDFHALCARYPELGHALCVLIAQRYRSYIELTRGLSLKSLTARLAQSLLRLGSMLGEERPFLGKTCVWISPVVTQSDLGIMARGSRGNVNRLLKAWREAGWIALQGRTIILVNKDAILNLTYAMTSSD